MNLGLNESPRLVERVRGHNPALRLDKIIATIWRLGYYRLAQNLLRRLPVGLVTSRGDDAGETIAGGGRFNFNLGERPAFVD